MRWIAALIPVIGIMIAGIVPAAAAGDPPTEFSKLVTGLTGDWVAEDWRRGILVLHPKIYTWQSDQYVNLFAEEPDMGRDALTVAKGHFEGDSLGDDSTDPTLVSFTGAEEIAPGILAKRYNWSYAFHRNVSFFGVVTTAAKTYIPFHANCERDDTDLPNQYKFENCIRQTLVLLLAIRGGEDLGGNRLIMPQTNAPLNVAGWDGQYLKDGTSLATTGSFNGLRKVLLYASAPRAVSPDELPKALKQFSDNIVHDDDDADKNPGSVNVVGSLDDPWIRREFPEAFEGPSIQMAGTAKTPDGKISFIGIRCPNKGWLKTCSYGVDQAKQQVRSGQMEARRQAYFAARQTPIPANGIKNAQVLGIYGTARFNGNSFVVDGSLYLKDGTVYNDTGTAPAFIDPVASKQKEPNNWGRWRRVGSTMQITWGNGETDTKKAAPSNFLIGGNSTTKLNGLYETVSSGGGVIAGSGWVSRASYQFFADGTFKNDRSNSFSVGGFVPGEAGPVQIAAGGGSSSTGKARYEIDGHMISFIYPDGQIERQSFAVYASDVNNINRKYILISGTPYTLDDD
jgi:hypothetical protein